MTAPTCQVAVVGAGPYGLSATAFLRRRHVETHLFGVPMEFWRKRVSPTLALHTPWEASHIADPDGVLSLDWFRSTRAIDPTTRIPRDYFIGYGEWYQQQIAPDVDRRRVAAIDPMPGGFTLRLDDGDIFRARRVIVATGLEGFAYCPPEIAELPRALVTLLDECPDPATFAGRRVAVVGSDPEAFEFAARASEQGSDVEHILGRPGAQPANRSALERTWLSQCRRTFDRCADASVAAVRSIVARPTVYRRLPLAARRSILAWHSSQRESSSSTNRPNGLPRRVRSAAVAGDLVRLVLDDETTILADHVVLGTGYRVDVSRLALLNPLLRQLLTCDGGYPVLSRGFESSVPGLHFIGALAAGSFGPHANYLAGTAYTGDTLGRWIDANVKLAGYIAATSWPGPARLEPAERLGNEVAAHR